MTVSVVVMIIIGFILIFASFFISEKMTKQEDNINLDLLTVDENYEFSEREIRVIRRKIEDVIARQAKDILYETNESLSNMANEKTMALGDYAVAVCEEIEKNHKEVMFLYSMLEDKQKEIMNTVRAVDEAKQNLKEMISETRKQAVTVEEPAKGTVKKMSGIDQLTALSQRKKEKESGQEKPVPVEPEVKESQEKPEVFVEPMKEEENLAEEMDMEDNNADLEDVFADINQAEIDFDEVLEEEFKESENSNDIILELYKSGNSIIDIAKQLGLGVGEVKLVIDLYRGE